MSEIVIDVDVPREEVSVLLSVCRICLGEDGNTAGLESPCSCSGTMKFAHRDCVQRWCDEKGNTNCEICLQKFEPGYTCKPKKPLQPALSASGESRIRNVVEQEGEEGNTAVEYSSSSATSTSAASCSRNLAIIVNVLLLILNLSAVFDSPSTRSLPLFTVVVARAFGIIVPMYVLFKFASRIENSIRHCSEVQDDEESQRLLDSQLHRP